VRRLLILATCLAFLFVGCRSGQTEWEHSLRKTEKQMALGIKAQEMCGDFFDVKTKGVSVNDASYLDGAMGVVFVGARRDDFIRFIEKRKESIPVSVYYDVGFIMLDFYGDDKKSVAYSVSFRFRDQLLYEWKCGVSYYVGGE
jgi:hypothetical protein